MQPIRNTLLLFHPPLCLPHPPFGHPTEREDPSFFLFSAVCCIRERHSSQWFMIRRPETVIPNPGALPWGGRALASEHHLQYLVGMTVEIVNGLYGKEMHERSYLFMKSMRSNFIYILPSLMHVLGCISFPGSLVLAFLIRCKETRYSMLWFFCRNLLKSSFSIQISYCWGSSPFPHSSPPASSNLALSVNLIWRFIQSERLGAWWI